MSNERLVVLQIYLIQTVKQEEEEYKMVEEYVQLLQQLKQGSVRLNSKKKCLIIPL